MSATPPRLAIHILTILPGLFAGAFSGGMLRKALERGICSIDVVNVRDYAPGPHRVTDDYPYGGGPGMIMKPEPLVTAVEQVRGAPPGDPATATVLLTPQGARFDQAMAAELAGLRRLVLICGRYEGVDERVRQLVVDREISIGDYVLSGGEFAALVLVDAVVRLLPGVLNQDEAAAQDSFAMGLLEGPQYTRPPEFRGLRVPDILLSGHHAEIARWRRKEALRRTLQRRPDLLARHPASGEERRLLAEIAAESRAGSGQEPPRVV